MSTSHFMMELNAVSSMPAASMPTMLGVNSTSGQRKRSLPIVITCAPRLATVSTCTFQWQLLLHTGQECPEHIAISCTPLLPHQQLSAALRLLLTATTCLRVIF